MKQFSLLLIAALIALQSVQGASPTDIPHFTKLAKQLRRSNYHTSDKELERIKSLNHEIVEQVPDFGAEDALEPLVAAFLNDALHTPFSLDRIIDSKKTPLSGLSNARVFFIYGEQGALQYIVKAFPFHRTPSGSFLAELSGMDLVRELNLPTVSVVKGLAVGKCALITDKGYKNYGLLLETVAPGKRADHYVTALFEYPAGGARRRELLAQAKKMCLAAGNGLAEFHGLNRMKRLTLSRDGFLRASLKYYQLFKPQVRARLKGKLNIEALKSYIEKKVRIILDRSRFYRHGDAGLENIFYESAKNRIIFIDVARIHDWTSRSGDPLSSDIADLFLFRKKLSLFEEKLTTEEFSSLLDALCDGYVGINQTETQETFYKAVKDLCESSDPVLNQKSLAFLRKVLQSN